jgi:hypothetical protein
MSWGIDFTADIFLAHQNYNENLYQVKDAINENEESIIDCEKAILMYASSNPKDIVPDEFKEDPINWIRIEVQQQLSSIKEYYGNILQLEYYKEYLEKKQKPNE